MVLQRSSVMFINYKNVKRINKLYKSYCTQRTHYDVIVAGGGMVGTTMACVLGKNNMFLDKKILLLEGGKEMKLTLNDNYSNRVSALNKQTYNLMNSIGAWAHIKQCRFAYVTSMQVWDACSDAMITFNEDGFDEVAFIVENDVILNAVNTELKNVGNVDIMYDAKVGKYETPIDSHTPVKVCMENGMNFTCDLLIGADGAKSMVRKTIGFDYASWDYGQMGVVATVKLSEPTENTVAWQRFLPTGVVALLPLNNDTSSLVWCTTPTEAKHLIGMSEEDFVDALNKALWKKFPRNQVVDSLTGAMNEILHSLMLKSNAVRQLPPTISGVMVKSRAGFPLGFGHSSNYVTNRVVLIGDAVHRVHPLAGQGVNLGFGDVMCLSKLLANSLYDGNTIYHWKTLKDFEKERLLHTVPTAFAIDGLQKLYKMSSTPAVLLRSLGLQIVHSLKPIKKAIIQHASR